MLVWHPWIGRARHPGPGAVSFAVEVLNVGGWVTEGDLVLDAEVDFLAVVEHKLIPARVRGGWARLRSKGLATVWAPASQDSSHVGHAGVGVVSLRGAPLSLPTFATAQFKRFFDCGRAVRCMLPSGCGRFLHLVVLYGYQGADREAEKLALTDQLLDAAFGELGVVSREQPCLVVGDFNREVSWLVVFGTVFFWVGSGVSLFHVGSVVLQTVMVTFLGKVPFLLLLRFVEILNFTIS